MIGNEHEPEHPFPAFRFQIGFVEHLIGPGARAGSPVPRCQGSFSECQGLEASMEPKVISEGGRNYGAAQRVGKVTFGTVVLKRGLTSNRDLWEWFQLVTENNGSAYRLTAMLTVLGPDPGRGARATPQTLWQWQLRQCLPIKFKAPDLNANAREIAIEELHLAHEGLSLVSPGRTGRS